MVAARGGLALAVIALAFVASAAGAQTPDATLPSSCSDQQVAPPRVILTCADGGFIAQDLAWTGWGGEQATANGTASVNTCVPSCAEGERETYPIVLTA